MPNWTTQPGSRTRVTGNTSIVCVQHCRNKLVQVLERRTHGPVQSSLSIGLLWYLWWIIYFMAQHCSRRGRKCSSLWLPKRDAPQSGICHPSVTTFHTPQTALFSFARGANGTGIYMYLRWFSKLPPVLCTRHMMGLLRQWTYCQEDIAFAEIETREQVHCKC